MTALKPRMTVRWTQLPPITLIMLTAVVLYLIFGAAWLLGGAWHAVTEVPFAILLLASLGACVGLVFALASRSRRDRTIVAPASGLPDQDQRPEPG